MAKEKETREKQTYRIQKSVYDKAVINSRKLKIPTSLASTLEDVAIIIATSQAKGNKLTQFMQDLKSEK